MVGDALLKAKIAALLHDPPYKLWTITAAFRGAGRVLAKKIEGERVAGDDFEECRGLTLVVGGNMRAHEREARALFQRIAVDKGVVSPEEGYSLWRVAADADILASAFDRWPLPAEADTEAHGEVVAPEALVNPLNPAFKMNLRSRGPPEPQRICRYLRLLAEAVGDAQGKGGARLAYHTLYALLEPLWYAADGLNPTPADTGVPTHTIFDHLYASAAMVNWAFTGGESCGALLHVDLAAVQEWIAAARRTGDMWAASWLASALAWTAVRPLVSELGPDIMLLPTARLNPFYLAWLYNELVEIGASKAADTLRVVLDKLGLLGNLLAELEASGGRARLIPRHPVMPVTMTLIVTCHDSGCERRYAEKVRKALLRAWEEIVEDLVNNLDESSKSLVESVKKEPPLPLRVVITRVCMGESGLKSFIAEAGAAAGLAGGGSKAEKRLLFPYALAKQAREAEASKKAAMRPGVAYSVEASRRAWSNGQRYDECTMCGVRPALPEEALSALKSEGVVEEAEHLCPYCLVKRLAWRSRLPSIGRLIHEGLTVLDDFRPVVPPVNILASVDAVAELCRLAGGKCESLGDIAEFLYSMQEHYNYNGVGYLKVGDEEVRSIYDLLEAYFRGDAKEAVIDKVAEVLAAMGRQVNRSAVEDALSLSNRYYAVILADGDGVGNAIWGRLGYTHQDAETYWNMVLSAVRDVSVKRLVTGERLADAARSVAKAMDRVTGAQDGRDRHPVVVPTPAYLFALSMSLMATAIVDALLSEAYWGIPVYAGGDDLLVLAPARSLAVAEKIAGKGSQGIAQLQGRLTPLFYTDNRNKLQIPVSSTVWADLVVTSRRWFWALESSNRGFHLLGGVMPIAAPAGLGRSYSVLLAHYREPLRLKVEAARALEKHAKAAAATKQVNWKDSVSVGYGRGRAPEPGEAGLFRNSPLKTPLEISSNRLDGKVGLPAAFAGALTLLLAARRGDLLGEKAKNLARRLQFKPVYTASLLYDLEESAEQVAKAVHAGSAAGTMPMLVASHVAERNIEDAAEPQKRDYALRLAKDLLESAGYWPRGVGEGVKSLLRALRYSRTAYG